MRSRFRSPEYLLFSFLSFFVLGPLQWQPRSSLHMKLLRRTGVAALRRRPVLVCIFRPFSAGIQSRRGSQCQVRCIEQRTGAVDQLCFKAYQLTLHFQPISKPLNHRDIATKCLSDSLHQPMLLPLAPSFLGKPLLSHHHTLEAGHVTFLGCDFEVRIDDTVIRR